MTIRKASGGKSLQFQFILNQEKGIILSKVSSMTVGMLNVLYYHQQYLRLVVAWVVLNHDTRWWNCSFLLSTPLIVYLQEQNIVKILFLVRDLRLISSNFCLFWGDQKSFFRFNLNCLSLIFFNNASFVQKETIVTIMDKRTSTSTTVSIRPKE